MAKTVAPEVPARNVKLYEALVATNPKIERKGAATPYTSKNGHMFSFLTKSGELALRLPEEERNNFIRKYKTQLCEQHGRIMQEYVVVPNSLLKKTGELKKYFAVSLAYVSSLKPKPTRRAKPVRVKGKKTSKTSTRKSAKKKIAISKTAKAKARTTLKKKKPSRKKKR